MGEKIIQNMMRNFKMIFLKMAAFTPTDFNSPKLLYIFGYRVDEGYRVEEGYRMDEEYRVDELQGIQGG